MTPLAWLLIALLLAIGEVLTGTLFLLSVAIGCLAAAVAALVGGLVIQIAAAIVGTTVSFVYARLLLDRVGYRTTARTNVDALAGQIGTVSESFDDVTGFGRVRLGGDDWRAKSLTGEPIEAGASVMVVNVEGATLVVAPEPGIGR